MTSAQQRASSGSSAKKFAQQWASSGSSAKKFAQQWASRGSSAKKFAQHAIKRSFWAILSTQGELFRAHTHHQTTQGELFRAQAAVTWRRCNQWHLCSRKTHPKRPFRTRKGDGGFNPTRARASKGDAGFRQPLRAQPHARSSENSHVIRLHKLSTTPRNIEIATITIQNLKQPQGNYVRD